MKFDVIPLQSVNNIKFGMPRTEVRALFDNKFKVFKKNKFSVNTTDDFGICHVYYTPNDLCETIEIFGNYQVYMNGNLIYPTNVSILKKYIPDLEIRDNDAISTNNSIAISMSNGNPESILFGSERYYG